MLKPTTSICIPFGWNLFVGEMATRRPGTGPTRTYGFVCKGSASVLAVSKLCMRTIGVVVIHASPLTLLRTCLVRPRYWLGVVCVHSILRSCDAMIWLA